MRALGQRHGALCRFIRQYTQSHGWPPRRREMGAALGCTSTSLVAYYLEALEQQGYVSCQPAISRGLVLTPAGQALAEHASAAESGRLSPCWSAAGRKPGLEAPRKRSPKPSPRGTLAALGRRNRHE